MLFQHSRVFHRTVCLNRRHLSRGRPLPAPLYALSSACPPQHPLLQSLPTLQTQQLDHYLDVLLETNQSLNLTAVRDKNEAWLRHIVDSLLLQSVIEDAATQLSVSLEDVKVLDVGSGGGLPGMCLAVARPDWHVTMLDSLNKRCRFMDSAIAQVGVPNAGTLWSRAEEAGQTDSHREQYHVVVARAVAELRVLAELCLPFVQVGGLWVAAKGPQPKEEVASATRALQELGGRLHSIVQVDSTASHGSRTAVVVQKVSATPSKYPRRPGMPNKRPL